MNIRRRVDFRTVVLEVDVIEDRRLSAAALGILAFLAAGDDDARGRAAILRRFRMTAADLEACLAELREAGHLQDGAPRPPARRSAREPRRRDAITQSGRVLFQVLASKVDRSGTVAPLNRELAADTGQHPRTVHRNLAALEAGGFLRREIDRGDQNGNTRRRIHLVPDPSEQPRSSTTPEGILQ